MTVVDLERVQRALIAALARDREVVRAGVLVAGIHLRSEHPMLSFAAPERPLAGDVSAGLAEIEAAFAARGRPARFEWVAALAPQLEEILVGRGYAIEGRHPLMAVAAADVVGVPVPAGFVLDPHGDAAESLAVANEAFGEPPPAPAEVERFDPWIAMLARDAATGTGAGRAQVLPPHEGVSEVVGVAVRERFRGRGLGAALTAAAAAAAADRGADLLVLTPGDDAAQRIYARAGFAPAATVLHARRDVAA